jgi:hypothetical protein
MSLFPRSLADAWRRPWWFESDPPPGPICWEHYRRELCIECQRRTVREIGRMVAGWHDRPWHSRSAWLRERLGDEL